MLNRHEAIILTHKSLSNPLILINDYIDNHLESDISNIISEVANRGLSECTLDVIFDKLLASCSQFNKFDYLELCYSKTIALLVEHDYELHFMFGSDLLLALSKHNNDMLHQDFMHSNFKDKHLSLNDMSLYHAMNAIISWK